jgi:hypothetical protein
MRSPTDWKVRSSRDVLDASLFLKIHFDLTGPLNIWPGEAI